MVWASRFFTIIGLNSALLNYSNAIRGMVVRLMEIGNILLFWLPKVIWWVIRIILFMFFIEFTRLRTCRSSSHRPTTTDRPKYSKNTLPCPVSKIPTTHLPRPPTPLIHSTINIENAPSGGSSPTTKRSPAIPSTWLSATSTVSTKNQSISASKTTRRLRWHCCCWPAKWMRSTLPKSAAWWPNVSTATRRRRS